MEARGLPVDADGMRGGSPIGRASMLGDRIRDALFGVLVPDPDIDMGGTGEACCEDEDEVFGLPVD